MPGIVVPVGDPCPQARRSPIFGQSSVSYQPGDMPWIAVANTDIQGLPDTVPIMNIEQGALVGERMSVRADCCC